MRRLSILCLLFLISVTRAQEKSVIDLGDITENISGYLLLDTITEKSRKDKSFYVLSIINNKTPITLPDGKLFKFSISKNLINCQNMNIKTNISGTAFSPIGEILETWDDDPSARVFTFSEMGEVHLMMVSQVCQIALGD